MSKDEVQRYFALEEIIEETEGKLKRLQARISDESDSQSEFNFQIKDGVEIQDTLGRAIDANNAKILEGTKLISDQNGQLRVLYHGSNSSDFEKFDANRIGENGSQFGKGVYFAFNKSDAETYGHNVSEWFANITKIYNDNAQFSEEELTQIFSEYKDDIEGLWGSIDLDRFLNKMFGKTAYDQRDILANNITGLSEDDLLKKLGYQGRYLQLEKSSGLVVFDLDNIIKARDVLSDIQQQSNKNPISAEIVQTEQQLAEETAKANSVMEEQKQKIAELEEQVEVIRSSLKAQGDELAHANEEYGNMMDELGRANDREDMLSEELLQQQQISEELREQNNTLKEQVENHQHEVESLQEVLKEEQEHVALTEEELDKQRTLAETYKMSVENERQVRKEAEQRADAYEEISRIAASGEAEADEKMRLEIEARQEAEKQLGIKKEENEELKKKLDLTEQITNESKTKIDSEEVTDIKAVQNAIKKKNNAFKAEEKTVDKSVTNEINKLKELEKVISENIPNAIDKKNDAFIGENEIVKQVIAEEKKTIKQSAPKESTGKTKSTSNNSFIKAYNTQFEKLKKAIASDKNIITDEIQEFYDVLSGKDIKSESSDAIKQYTDDIKNLLATIEKRGNETKLLKNINDATNTLQKNTAMPKKLARDYQQLIDEMQAMVEAGGYTNKQVAEMTQRLIRLNTAFANTGKSGRSFFGMIANDVKTSSARLIAQYMSFQDLIRYARSAVQAVTQLDTALTQLRVVSGASETELNRVAKSAYNMANALGSTTTEITNSITEWRRLGYSIEESQKLAEQAAKLSTGGLMDVSSATTSLISAMQAFEMGADEVSNVVDQYIYLGKRIAHDNYIG
jgi:hypothetical protein